MIVLYTFGPAFGLPDPSPFVTKAEMLLKLSGQAFETKHGDLRKTPKGKLPYIDDDNEIIPDSTFIRRHLEKKYAVDFDAGLTSEQRAIGWAFEKMAEDNFYWTMVDARWMDEENFNKGPRHFFRIIPAPLRPVVIAMVRRSLRKAIHGHGMGRHSKDDIVTLGKLSIDAIAAYLGDKSYFMGDEPKGVDATMFAFVAGTLCPYFETPIRTAAEQHENLRRYVGRIAKRFYPGANDIAGCAVGA